MTNRIITVDPERILGCEDKGCVFSDDIKDTDSGRELFVFPGFCDVHVHFREPGFSYKETILSGSLAAARGGYTDVCTMPNLDPVPDSPEHLEVQKRIIEESSVIRIHPYGAITEREEGKKLSDMEGMAKGIVAFSDDGKGIQSDEMMRSAMLKAKALGKIIAAHCEDESLLNGGYIHDGRYAAEHGHRGISSESEYRQIERDLKLAEETGCAYHVCHISAKESVDAVRKAKARGVDVTCETAPHYLVLCEDDLQEEGRFKMNPPLRSREDREALIKGLQDGTIDMIATDHAPHSAEEKSRGLEKSAFGITGLETAFPVLYSSLVLSGRISLERLITLMSSAPRKRFGITGDPGYTVWDLDEAYRIDTGQFLSKGRSTPFEGMEVHGSCIKTVINGKEIYRR
ncbi:MAG: dihydroorotase [Oscillospiraceae bacterium]|nr:dihydroorotase [Oscillospiraceae bacterium]